MRTNGNLALNPAYRPDYQPTQTSLRKKADITSAKHVKATKKSGLLVALIYIAVIFSIALCLVTREVRLYEKSNRVNALQQELEEAETATKQAIVASEQAIDLVMIEANATTKYGMSKPQKHQVIYINVCQEDYVEKTADKQLGDNFYDGLSAVFGIFGIH